MRPTANRSHNVRGRQHGIALPAARWKGFCGVRNPQDKPLGHAHRRARSLAASQVVV